MNALKHLYSVSTCSNLIYSSHFHSHSMFNVLSPFYNFVCRDICRQEELVVTSREIKENDLKTLAVTVATLIRSCWNSLTRSDKTLAYRKWFSLRNVEKPGFAQCIMVARFLVYHTVPAGIVNLEMTLYFDLGSKGIRILAYPWFIRVIGTNKFPYI